MVVERADPAGDVGREDVPAALVGVLTVEVVSRILTGTAVRFDDVLLGVADHDGEIAVLLDTLFGDGLDGAHATVAVSVDDAPGYRGVEFAGFVERRAPLLGRRHTPPSRRWIKTRSMGRTVKRAAFRARPPTPAMYVSEGGIELDVPEQPEAGVGEGVFFNPVQELNRDLTVGVLRADGRDRKIESYLDATAASGVRGVRAATEGFDVTCCDIDPDAVALCRENLSRNGLAGTVVERNANALMHEARFDVVDIDPFGTPMAFADAAVRSARSLLCVTATDTAPLCGAHEASGIRSYSAVPQNTEYHAEMGLRVLLGALVRTAARHDVAALPILSHATSHYVRTYLDFTRRASAANDALEELGYVHHCFSCLHRKSESGLIAHPPEDCPACGSRVRTAGPLWLGGVNDAAFVADVRAELTDEMGSRGRAEALLDTLEGELETPTHYDQHRLCRAWSCSANAMDDFLDDLRAAGFAASRAHYDGTAFKTNASVAEIRAAAAPDRVA